MRGQRPEDKADGRRGDSVREQGKRTAIQSIVENIPQSFESLEPEIVIATATGFTVL